MTLPLPSSDNVLNIYLTLSQYPILGHRIRSRMRKELFKRGIISQEDFETEARQKAIASPKDCKIHLAKRARMSGRGACHVFALH